MAHREEGEEEEDDDDVLADVGSVGVAGTLLVSVRAMAKARDAAGTTNASVGCIMDEEENNIKATATAPMLAASAW
jgi:hypothetical protein